MLTFLMLGRNMLVCISCAEGINKMIPSFHYPSATCLFCMYYWKFINALWCVLTTRSYYMSSYSQMCCCISLIFFSAYSVIFPLVSFFVFSRRLVELMLKK